MVKDNKIRVGKTTGVIEWGISEDRGYCIIEENNNIIYVAKEQDTIVHHCSKTINTCKHIDELSHFYRQQGIPFIARKRSFESARKASIKILSQLLQEGKISAESPIQLLRVFQLMPERQFRMLWRQISLKWVNQSPLNRMFELTGVTISAVRQISAMKGKEGLASRSIRIVEEQLFNKHLVSEIDAENWKTILKEVYNTYQSAKEQVIKEIKRRVDGFWKDRNEEIVKTMFMMHCIDTWIKEIEEWTGINPTMNIKHEITPYLDKFKNSNSKIARNKIGFALALANETHPPMDLKKLRLRKLELKKYMSETFGISNEKRRKNAITLDDFFIYLLEKLKARPSYDFPIRRYYDNVYLPESILMDYPILRFILERIKQENYLTYDDVTNHLKLFKWLGGEKIQSNYKDRLLGTSNPIIPANAFIVQWDIRSNYGEGDIMHFQYDGRTYELDFSEAIKMGIAPFSYTVCTIEREGKINIFEIINAETVLKSIESQPIKIVSSLLPWYLLTDKETIELTQLNKGIRECKEKWFIQGAQILEKKLQEFLENEWWYHDSRKYEEIKERLINGEFKYGKEELWDLIPKRIQELMEMDIPESKVRDMLLIEAIKISPDIYTALEYIIKKFGRNDSRN